MKLDRRGLDTLDVHAGVANHDALHDLLSRHFAEGKDRSFVQLGFV